MTMTVCAFLVIFQTVLAILTYFYFRHEIKRIISNQQFTMVSLIAGNIDQKLASSLSVIIEVSRHVSGTTVQDPEAAQHFLDSRPGTLSIFDNGLFLFDPDGRIIAESPYRPNRRGRDISFREFFKRTIATGKPLISAPYISTHTPGAPAIMFTAPVHDQQGKLIAVLGGSLNLLHDNFLGELARTRIAETGYLYLVTRDRNLIMHPDRSRILKNPEPAGANPLLEQALNGFEGTRENTNAAGKRHLTTFKHLQAVDWIVGANYPISEAFRPLRGIQFYFLVLAIVGAVLNFFVAKLVMERFTAALVRFADHVRNISDKRGEERLFHHASDDEVGVLARTFNAMVRDEDQKSAELFRTSTHDSLTGLYNRAYFDSELERLSRGRQVPISVVVADIDGLKICNDTWGHAAGDALITAAARVFMDSFRAEDIVARIGGDEFAILLPGMDREHVEMVLARIRKTIAVTPPALGSCKLSVSLGSTTCNSPECLLDAFRQADRQMYVNKAKHKQSLEFAP